MALRKLVDDLKVQQSPEPCLRQKYGIKFESDLTLFQSMEMGDVWQDADLPSCYMYLYKNKKLQIPAPWKETMSEFTRQLKHVTCST